jgi:ankyrin repeat protein
VYRKVGFEAVGWGQTWWIHRRMLEAPPPSATMVRFVEALGCGDLETLNALDLNRDDLDAFLLCGMTPLQVAVATSQTESAEWLLERGAAPDPISLWDMGWRDRAPEFLAKFPDAPSRPIQINGKTPLHEAVLRRDGELLRWLLGQGADPSRRDKDHDSDPRGWARFFGYQDLMRIFDEAA